MDELKIHLFGIFIYGRVFVYDELLHRHTDRQAD